MKSIISLTVAGGGKTTMLIKRLKELDSTRVLVFSFTNASADDITIRARAEGLNVQAQTLHSFIANLLKSNYTLMEDHEYLVSLFLKAYRILGSFGVYHVASWIDSYMLFKKPVDLEDLTVDKELNMELQMLIKQIELEKEKLNYVGFSDFIHEFLKNIQTLLLEVSITYDHIFVDEAQDLSFLQLKILSELIINCFNEPNKTFFIVGDINQCIYDFQGSSPLYYQEFINGLRLLPGVEYIEQNITYRFGGEILEFVNKKSNISHVNISNPSSQVIHKSFVDPKSLNEYIQSIIPELQGSTLILYNTINSYIVNLQKQTKTLAINMKIYLEYNPLIDSLRDIYNYLLDQDNLYYRTRILQGVFHYITEPHLWFLKEYNVLSTYKQEWFNELLTKTLATEMLEFLAPHMKSNYMDHLLFQELYLLAHKVGSFLSFVLTLPNRIHLQQPKPVFSTVHSAKGLEAHNVIYINFPSKPKHFINLNPFFICQNPQLLQGKLKDYYQLHEEMKKITKENLLYVAFSRAKKNLYILDVEEG